MNSRLRVPKAKLAAFCRALGIRRLAIFGSALREDFGPSSDIDILVECTPGCAPGLLGMAGMEIELAAIFGGRKVDLQTPEDLSQYFRREILGASEVQYVQG